jgi:hypothetical protein
VRVVLRRWTLLACLFIYGAICSAESGDLSLSTTILAEARRILAQTQETAYSHKLKVDEKAGRYLVDCSGFVALILKNTSPAHLDALPCLCGKQRPLAADFVSAFNASPVLPTGWERVAKVADITGGDVVAWEKPDHPEGSDTGHVFIADGTPVLENNGQYRLRIIDSTKSPHAEDSRTEDQTGIGRGVIWLQADDSGRPVSYRWKSTAGTVHREPIAIGRAIRTRDIQLPVSEKATSGRVEP